METKMKKSYLTFITLIFFSISLNAQLSKKFEPIDIFDIEYVSSPQISPKGDKILFLRNFKDIMTDKNLSNLWVVNFDGSDMMPITTGNHNASSPKWSNSGKMFTFKSNKEGMPLRNHDYVFIKAPDLSFLFQPFDICIHF